MSEHIHEQVSEFVDDEMSAEECDFFVRRLQRDNDARARFVRYQAIGAVLRQENVRVQPAIGPAPVVSRSPGWSARFGMAAGVMLAVVVGFLSGDSMLSSESDATTQRLVGSSDVTSMQLLIHHMGSSPGLNRTLMHSGVFSGIESSPDEFEPDEPLD